MSLSNICQVLLRNKQYLQASRPLFVNLPCDGFIEDYLSEFSHAQPTYYSTNYEQYLLAKQLKDKRVTTVFSAQYNAKEQHDLLVLQFPKSKAELTFTLAMLAEHLTEDAQILIVGENKSGIKSLEKLTKTYFNYCNKVDSARHCILFSATMAALDTPFKLDNWYNYYTLEISGTKIKVAALPGVFSQKGLDVGTKVLLKNLPTHLKGAMLDFGCGAGVIASYIAKTCSTTSIDLLDVSALAIASAEKTLALNNVTGQVFPSNSLSELTKKYDVVVSNPPFHQGIKTNYHATESFLAGISKFSRSNASIIVVANSFLRYQPIMESSIGTTKRIAQENGFTVYHCQTR